MKLFLVLLFVALIVATAGMIRFYMSRSRTMGGGAFIALAGATVVMFSSVAEGISNPPPLTDTLDVLEYVGVVVYVVGIGIGVTKHLRVKR